MDSRPRVNIHLHSTPGDYGLAASLWAFGIEGETPAVDAVMVPLIEQGKAATEDMRLHRFEPQR